MINFFNNGDLDIRGATTFGLTHKRDQSTIGRFGTGLKYALSVIMRGGGTVTIQTGKEQFKFTTRTEDFRDVQHDFVCMNDEKLSFTTSLGKDWEPWMAFRELYSNALDEGGKIYRTDNLPKAQKDKTIITVDWPVFDAIYFSIEEHFISPDEEPIWSSGQIEVYAGKSKFVFYKGIAVMELKKPAVYRYNIKTYVLLTEDRTAQHGWLVEKTIAEALIHVENEDVAANITSMRNGFEAKLDFADASDEEPSAAFLGAAGKNGTDCNPSAAKLVAAYAPDSNGDLATIISPEQPGGKCLLSSLKMMRILGEEDVSKLKWVLDPDQRLGTSDYIVRGNLVILCASIFENQQQMDCAVIKAFGTFKKVEKWAFKKLRQISEKLKKEAE